MFWHTDLGTQMRGRFVHIRFTNTKLVGWPWSSPPHCHIRDVADWLTGWLDDHRLCRFREEYILILLINYCMFEANIVGGPFFSSSSYDELDNSCLIHARHWVDLPSQKPIEKRQRQNRWRFSTTGDRSPTIPISLRLCENNLWLLVTLSDLHTVSI